MDWSPGKGKCLNWRRAGAGTTGVGGGAKKGESENGRGGACRRQGSCGRTVRELRSAIKDKVGHVILMGVSWSEREEEV